MGYFLVTNINRARWSEVKPHYLPRLKLVAIFYLVDINEQIKISGHLGFRTG
jgi:hypothetical protein